MSRKIVITPLAESEIRSARDWYEGQRKGLGRKFRSALKGHIQQIEAYPESFPVYFNGVRRLRMQNYPYYIYYRLTDEYIEIITVFHPSRDPEDLANALAD